MDTKLDNVIGTLLHLEPHEPLDVHEFTVYVADGIYHCSSLPGVGCDLPTAGTTPVQTAVAVSELDELTACQGCVTTEFAILNTLRNRDLADAAICLDSHTNLDTDEAINRSEYNSHTITMQGISVLADSHASFLEYTENTHTRLYRFVNDRYKEVIEAEFSILPERIADVHRAGIGNPELTRRFEHFAATIIGNPLDRTPVTVALRGIHDPYGQPVVNLFTDNAAKLRYQHEGFERGVLMAYVPAARTTAGLYEVPRWVAQVMRTVNPRRVASSDIAEIDPRVLDTATKIWSQDPNEELYDFDTALRSAEMLVGGA